MVRRRLRAMEGTEVVAVDVKGAEIVLVHLR